MTADERLMILQMVADKKITVSEAAELLRVIEPGEAAEAGTADTDGKKTGFSASARSATGERPEPGPGFGSGLAAFIEDVVERVTSTFSETVGPRYEFPTELTGEFTASEVSLKLASSNGRVEVHGWDQPGYKASILVKVRAANEEEARNRARDAFTVESGEGRFELEARRHDYGDIQVTATLMVPKDRLYRLETRTGNGAIELTDLPLRDGQITTGNGRVVCRGGQADELHLRSGNGSIEVESDVANLDGGTGNGSLTVRPTGSRTQSLRLATGNGSAKVDTGRLGAVGYKIDAHTAMGGIDVSLPNLVYDRDVRAMGHKHVIARSSGTEQAVITITARTGMGSISVY